MKAVMLAPYFYPVVNGVSICIAERIEYFLKHGHTLNLILPDYSAVHPMTVRLATRVAELAFFKTRTAPNELGRIPEIGAVDKVFRTIATKAHADRVIIDDPAAFFLTSFFVPRRRAWPSTAHFIAIAHGDTFEGLNRNGFPIVASLMRLVYPLIYAGYNKTLFPSSDVMERHPRILNGMKVDFLGIDPARFRYFEREAGEELHVVTVSRLSRDKNVEILLRAAEHMVGKTEKSLVWDIVGDGPDGPRLRAIANSGKAKVRFHGFVDYGNIQDVYNRADIYLGTCDYESFGLTIAEAMATGLPVLAPSGGNAAKQFVDGESGFAYESADVPRLCKLLGLLIEDETLRRAVGEKAVKIPLSWEVACGNLLRSMEAVQ